MVSSDRYMPIPSRTVGKEAVDVIQELKSVHASHLRQASRGQDDLKVFCMKALHQPGWTAERRLAAGMLIKQVGDASCCNGIIMSDWCPGLETQGSEIP